MPVKASLILELRDNRNLMVSEYMVKVEKADTLSTIINFYLTVGFRRFFSK
jgi:hypothetical protein